MPKGKYKSMYALNKRADTIGRVRLRTAENMRKGMKRSKAMKLAWKQVR